MEVERKLGITSVICLKKSSCGNSSCTLCTSVHVVFLGRGGGVTISFQQKTVPTSAKQPSPNLPKSAPWGMVFPSRALIGRCALRSTRALERLVTATMPRRVTHAVPIVPFVLAREAGAWTQGTRRPGPTWLVPWLGWAQLEATKKVAMIYQGRQYSASWRATKNISKLVKLERKPCENAVKTWPSPCHAPNNSIKWLDPSANHKIVPKLSCSVLVLWGCPQEFLLNFQPSICKSFTLSFILGCTRLYLFAKHVTQHIPPYWASFPKNFWLILGGAVHMLHDSKWL